MARFAMLGRMWPKYALVLLLSLALAGCGGATPKGGSPSTRPQSQPIEGGHTLAALWPLTGLPANSATPKHPVMVVKIDNTDSSRPQIGLKKADLVTEELVEGGITRLAVLFYSHVPDLVGPVRSMRASDIGVVKPTHGVLVASGAAPPTLGRLHGARVRYFVEGAPGYFRDFSRVPPYNLFVHLNQLAASLSKQAIVPASYLPWGTPNKLTGPLARNISVRFSPSHTTLWKYAGGRYFNLNSEAALGTGFAPKTVLVLRVNEGNAGYLDPAGHTVPETIYQGRGNLLMFHGGKLQRGTWSKKRLASPLVLRTRTGALKVPPGHVWIELLPVNGQGGLVTWTR